MQKDYGVLPGGYSAGMYVAGQCVEAALGKTGGKSDDKKALQRRAAQRLARPTRRAARSASIACGNVVGAVFVRRCESKGGKLVNTTIKTYPKVSQFWTYPPEGVPEAARLLARLPAGEEPAVKLRRREPAAKGW